MNGLTVHPSTSSGRTVKPNNLSRLKWEALPSIEMSRLRVAERVAHGGHHIPTADIERRFGRSLSNLFEVFSFAVDNCRCYINIDMLPELIFEQQGELRSIVHTAHYQHLLEKAIP